MDDFADFPICIFFGKFPKNMLTLKQLLSAKGKDNLIKIFEYCKKCVKDKEIENRSSLLDSVGLCWICLDSRLRRGCTNACQSVSICLYVFADSFSFLLGFY